MNLRGKHFQKAVDVDKHVDEQLEMGDVPSGERYDLEENGCLSWWMGWSRVLTHYFGGGRRHHWFAPHLDHVPAGPCGKHALVRHLALHGSRTPQVTLLPLPKLLTSATQSCIHNTSWLTSEQSEEKRTVQSGRLPNVWRRTDIALKPGVQSTPMGRLGQDQSSTGLHLRASLE